MRKLSLILITLLLAVSFMTAQEIREKATIVVIPFDTKDIESNDAEALFDTFTNKIVDSGKFKVVDRSKVNEIRKQHEFQNSDWSNDDKVAKLGNALNASLVVVGKIQPFQKQLKAYFRIQDVNTMEIVETSEGLFSNVLELFNKMPEVVKKLTGEIKDISTTSNISADTDVSMTQIEVTESPKDEKSNIQENESQNIDFSFPDKQTVSKSFSEKELKDANNRYLNNITGGAMLLTFGIMSSVTGLILAIVGFVQYDYYDNKTPSLDDYKDYYGNYDYDSYHDDCDYYSDNANGYLAMGILGIVPLLTGGLLMTFLSAIPFSSASTINTKYLSVSNTGGYGNKNERLEIAFGYRF